jgi:hypothetical protein
MKRRKFLLSLLIIAPMTYLSSEVQSFTFLEKFIFGSKTKQLASNGIYLASKNTVFVLPSAPNHGDVVRIVVDHNSLLSVCKLRSNGATIAGDKSDLSLDSLAIVKFKFDAHNRDWKIS